MDISCNVPENTQHIRSIGRLSCLNPSQPSPNVLAAGHLAAYNKIHVHCICPLLHTCQTCIQDEVASAAYYYSQLAYYSRTF